MRTHRLFRKMGRICRMSGARPSENNFRVDGVSVNDNSNSTPGSILGSNLGVEAIREFSIVSNSYSAEYGRSTGAVVNAVTKSGTNALQGDAFYLHRNSDLDARNFFDGATIPPFRCHQFGGSLDGAIIQNVWGATTMDPTTRAANSQIRRPVGLD